MKAAWLVSQLTSFLETQKSFNNVPIQRRVLTLSPGKYHPN